MSEQGFKKYLQYRLDQTAAPKTSKQLSPPPSPAESPDMTTVQTKAQPSSQQSPEHGSYTPYCVSERTVQAL